jgi:type I restriction enzyme, S subunit
VPKVRFVGFSGDWGKVPLSAVIQKQIKGKAQIDKLSDGEVEYLDANRLNGGHPFKSNGIQDVSEHDILILWDGSKAGTVYKGFSGALGSTLKAYSMESNNSSDFIYQQLISDQEKIYQHYRTPNIPHVIKDFTDVFIVCITSLKEQQKIGTFFKQLDDTISLHKKKMEDYQQLKKALLQRMFI